ncbi:MAG: hypothetical protein ACFFDK_07340 [Promethearchaeota archaeon]
MNSICSQWALILSNGKIIETSLEDKNLGRIKILRILKAVLNDMEIGSVIIIKNLVIFRLTFDFFIFLVGEIPRTILRQKFNEISSAYKADIKQKFDKKNRSKNIKIRSVTFSMALEDGPVPIYYFPENFDDNEAFKVAMKSLLLLSVESSGASRDMISFQPYIDLNSLGIVYLFQIENLNARGGAYDSAITVLVDYKYRGVIYENYNLIEKTLREAKDQFVKEYNSRKNYKKIIESTLENLDTVSFENIEREDIQDEMIEQIKKLAKL